MRAFTSGAVLRPLVAAGAMAFGSLPAMADIVYDNTTTLSSGFTFNGAADVNGTTVTNLDINQLNLAAGSAGARIDSVTFQALNINASAVTAGAVIDIWASNAAGTGPGSLLGSYSINSQSLNPSVTALTATVPLGTLIVPSNGTIWAGIYFDTPTSDTSIAELNGLGGIAYHPATIGTDGPDAYYVSPSNPLGYNVDNPTLILFDDTSSANYGWTVDAAAPVPLPAAGWLLVSGLGGLGAMMRRRKATYG